MHLKGTGGRGGKNGAAAQSASRKGTGNNQTTQGRAGAAKCCVHGFSHDKTPYAPLAKARANTRKGPSRRERKGPDGYKRGNKLLDVVLLHESVNGTVLGKLLQSLVDLLGELGVVLVDSDGILLAGADLLDRKSVV